MLVAAPCQDRLIRGVSASALVFDEASHFVSESWGPRTLERIWQAARPLLTIYGEQGRTLGISTPTDGDDFYGRLFVQAENGALPGAVAFRASTQGTEPRRLGPFLEAERLLLGEAVFRREYLAEFTAGGGGAFLEEDAVQAVNGRYHELRPDQGTGWLIGFDAAFSSDPPRRSSSAATPTTRNGSSSRTRNGGSRNGPAASVAPPKPSRNGWT